MPESPADSSHALVGQVLGQTYEVLRPLGEGGMGAVYEVANVRLGKRLAVKVLTGLERSDPEVVQRFRREAQIATDLGHPNIIDVIDFNETPEGVPYMVMEMLQGEDLQALLSRSSTLPLERAGLILMQICSALGAVHGAGVIHRDLKPGNIFLCANRAYADFVKVLDFGISKILGSTSLVTLDRSVMGTPFFMAPEQARGAVKEIGPWTDIFALGVIFYRMLTGQLPFASKELTSLLYQVVHQEPTPLEEHLPDLPAGVAPMIRRAMAKAPGDRFASIEDFARALQQAVPDLPGPVMSWAQGRDGEKLFNAEAAVQPGAGAAARSGAGATDADPLGPTLPPTTGYGQAMEPASGASRSSPRWLVWLAALAVALLLTLGVFLLRAPVETGGGERAVVDPRRGPDLSSAADLPSAVDPPRDRAADQRPAPDVQVAREGSPAIREEGAAVEFLLRGRPRGAWVYDLETEMKLTRIPGSITWRWAGPTRRVKVEARGYITRVFTLHRERGKARLRLKRAPARLPLVPDNPHK